MCHCHVLQSFCEFIISLAMDSTSDVSVLQLDNPVQIFYQVWYLKGMPIRRKLNDVVDGLAIIIGPVHRYPFIFLRWFEDAEEVSQSNLVLQISPDILFQMAVA